MALAHKGLDFRSMPTTFTGVASVEEGMSKIVPVIRDGHKVVADSFDIALYLDEAYPDLRLLFLFAIGGLTGVFLGTLSVDVHLHDTYFVIAHFHYVMFGGTVIGFMAGIHYWWPKMTGKMYNETLGRIGTPQGVRPRGPVRPVEPPRPRGLPHGQPRRPLLGDHVFRGGDQMLAQAPRVVAVAQYRRFSR